MCANHKTFIVASDNKHTFGLTVQMANNIKHRRLQCGVILAALTVLVVAYGGLFTSHCPRTTIKTTQAKLGASTQILVWNGTRLDVSTDEDARQHQSHQSDSWLTATEGESELLKKELSKDMQRCSLAMGMSQDTVNQSLDKINRIAEKAAFFLDTFWEVVPKPQDFLPDYKNPCFYSNVSITKSLAKYFVSKLPAYKRITLPKADIPWLYRELYEKEGAHQTLHCLPYFLLPGIPKSGTTTLHSVLAHHPQIAKAERKEPQWWYKLPLQDEKYLKVLIGRYLTNFLGASKRVHSRIEGKSLITYDGSQTMMVSVHDSSFHIDYEDYCALPAVISRVLPNAKIILLMRDPVPRAFSHYLYMHGPDTNKWPDDMQQNASVYFDSSIKEALSAFKECTAGSLSLYECVNQVRTNAEELKMWLGMGVYHIHIQKWMQFWTEDNFLLLKMEDMVANPIATLTCMTDFLSLDPVSGSQVRTWFENPQNVRKTKAKLLSGTRQLLEAFYEPFNQKLEQLFGINWLYQLI